MDHDDILTDDYVAGLLSQEASDCSIKYSAMGVDAFLSSASKKKPENMPKPNTRFLRNIIKGTDTHNKALLAKEAAESKARLKRLERNEEIKQKRTNPTTKDIRERHMGDIQAILGGRRRKRPDVDKDAESKDRNDESGHAVKSRKTGDEKEDSKSRRRNSTRYSDESKKHPSSRRDKDRSRRSRHRDDSSDEEQLSRKRRRSRDERSRSPTDRNGHSKHRSGRDSDCHGRHDRARQRSRSSPSATRGKDATSDDLHDEMIGPAPPLKIRGRGAVGASSGIDRRFSASYDPKTDVQGVDGVAYNSIWGSTTTSML